MLNESFILALRAIRRNLMRSVLTVFGVVIGVTAVITMVTLGRGATVAVGESISRLGSNILHLRSGQRRRGPGGARADASTFTPGEERAGGNVCLVGATIVRELFDGQAPPGATTTSTYATCKRSPRRRRARPRSSPACSPRSRPSACWWAGWAS